MSSLTPKNNLHLLVKKTPQQITIIMTQKRQNQHTADIILRSSDKVLFYSWKIYLSISSPVFSDMFTLPQPKSDTPDDVDERHNGLPVINLEEDGCTLDHILILCHPPSYTAKQFEVNSIRELSAILEATTKYDMENAHRVALQALSKPSLLCEDPLWTYALACRYECREAVALAAKHTLALPSWVHEDVPDLEKIHAGRLCRLLLYREACISVACSLAADHTWFVYTDFLPLFGCGRWDGDEDMEWTTVRNPPSRKYRSGREERKPVHKWWMEYMRRSEYALHKSPHGEAVKDKGLVDDALTAIATSECERCKGLQISEKFRSFVHVFAENIEHRVAEIEIDLGF